MNGDIKLELHLDAARHEHPRELPGYRNGIRERRWDTRGTIDCGCHEGG